MSPGAVNNALCAEQHGAPNIILILADDLGFSDIGCYGSEIRTRNLDHLAATGLRFSQFYNSARCCPTRAALMTGLYPHQTGIGHMMDNWMKPGYRGDLNNRCVTIAEALRTAGYQTYMCGKWHLTRDVLPTDNQMNWPVQRGFDHFFGTIHGGGSYFDPVTLTRQNSPVRPTTDFYYTDAIGQQAAEFLDKAAQSQRPFFLYVAFTAPHWPLHARPELIDRQRGRYAPGWDDLRRSRHQKMIDLGLVRRTWPLSPRDPDVPVWESAPHRDWQQRRMEVYAAQIEGMDQAIGRILDRLQQTGTRQNTLVLFLSDNGGCAEEIASNWTGLHIPRATRPGQTATIVGNDPSRTPGGADTYQSYGIGWANASNTPFRLFKHWVHEGGIATPMIASWPAGIKQQGVVVHDIAHIIDIVPTCCQLARIKYPENLAGWPRLPLEGESLVPIFQGKSRLRGPIFWEHEGNRAMRDGKWKLVSRHPGDWELYNMEADRTELTNMAERFPVIVKDMVQSYEDWANRANVEPWCPAPGKKPAAKK